MPMSSRLPSPGMPLCRRAAVAAFTAWAAACVTPAQAWVLTVTPGARTIYLQVGVGTKDAANAAVNVVSVSVPATALGSGTAQAMTSDSTAANSFYDNYAVCNPPQQVYVGGYLRTPSGSASAAVMQVSTPTSLTSAAGDAIGFSAISWTSSANGNATADIPAGTFNGATQVLRNIAPNTWVENCLSFNYANAAVVPAGTYQGRATFTLTAP
jgi:hypothetical protein